ncbi:MAG: hypothetical protein RLZZ175_2073 [Bacteroidota bacterium]|jgi:hypothetical protein
MKIKQRLNLKLLYILTGIFTCLLSDLSAQAPTVTLQQGLPISSTAPLRALAYGNGKYITGGNYSLSPGLLYSSSDAKNWTKLTDASIPSTAVFQSAVYANGIFVFTGDNGLILTSTDGVSWTTRTSGISTSITSVNYISGAFYATASPNVLLKSTDGITWSQITAGSSSYIFMNITYGNNVFAIGARDNVSNNSYVFYSSTGASNSWSMSTVASSGQSLNSIKFLKDKFYVFTSSGETYTSSNASSWTDISGYTVNLPNNSTTTIRGTAPSALNQMFNGIYDGTKVSLFGSTSYLGGYGAVLTSTDGTTWTHQVKTNSVVVQNAEYLNGYSFVLGNEGLAYSTDGINFNYPTGSYNGLVKNGNTFIAVGNTGSSEGIIYNSSDWSNWSNKTNYGVNALNAVIYNGSQYYAVGNSGNTSSSSDGITWTNSTVGTSDALKSIAYGNSKYVAVGNQGVIMYSSNGTTWTQANKDGAAGSNFYSVRYLNGKFIAVGGATSNTGVTRLAYSSDGINWTTNPTTLVGHFHDIAYDGTRYILIGRINSATSADREFFSLTISDITSTTFQSPIYLAASKTNNIKLGSVGVGAISYSNGRWVVVANQNATPFNAYIVYSTDNGSTWDAVAVGTTGRLRAIAADGDNFRVVGTNDVKAVVSFPSATSITVTGTLSAYTSCSGTSSASQSFTVSGAGLTSNIVITAPTGFEVSTSSGSGYGSSVSLSPSSGTISSTSIYVRLTSSATGNPSGNVSISSTGATTQNIPVTGTVTTTPSAPTYLSADPICGPGTVTLNGPGRLSTPVSPFKMYDAEIGGNLVANDLTTPLVSQNTDFWLTQSYEGCESQRAKVSVLVKQKSTSLMVKSVCDSYVFNNMTITQSGIYKDTLVNAVGCDSVVTLDLTINITPSAPTYLSAEPICGSGEVTFMDSRRLAKPSNPYTLYVSATDNNVYYEGTTTPVITQTTDFWITEKLNGCESAKAKVTAVVKQPTASSMNKSACGSYVFNNMTITQSGIYKDTLVNAVGCDSVLTLNLTIKSIPENPLPQATSAICGEGKVQIGANFNARLGGVMTSYYKMYDAQVNGNVVDSAAFDLSTPVINKTTTYFVSSVIDGCESGRVAVDAVVNLLPSVGIIVTPNDTVNTGEKITLIGTGATNYTWNKNVFNGVAFEPTNGVEYIVEGTDGNGCKSSDSITIVVNMLTNVETFNTTSISIYPNPATDNVTVSLTESVSGTVSIVDLHGNVVATKSISGNTSNISTAELASGVYVVKINSDKGIAVKQLVIQ